MCKTCGVNVYQHPKGGTFKAVLPTNFHIEQGDVGCLLPDVMRPTTHINYENRLLDSADNLPKCKAFPGGALMNNDGTIKEA